MKLSRILVCVDGSSASFHAARAAIDLAGATKAGLAVLAVVDPSRLAVAGLREAGPQRQSDAQAVLDRVARMAAESGIEAGTRLRSGIVFEEILDEARREEADLVVMGRSGRHGLAGGLVGSSALRVAEFTDRPLLLVPAPER